jgi:phenylacetate-coenzyme A ligase PaaK-like adenylate-forming protein
MLSSFDPWMTGVVASDVAWASCAGVQGLADRRKRRLAELLAAAARDSALYRRLLEPVDLNRLRLRDVPSVHKAELMHRFDEWVADPRLHLEALRRFTADPARIAEPFLGRYTVWESSGSSGEPAIFVQDAAAMAVYDALEALRRPAPWSLDRLLDPWYLSERIAFVGATTGHFASTVSAERLRRLNPAMARCLHEVSFLQSAERLVAELHALSPTVLSTYPSAALMLAEERLAGRLEVHLREVWTGGETLSASTRRFVQQAFGCPVVDSYGASEFLSLAFECRYHRLHLNSDWAILESVDEQGLEVPAGECGTTTLLTNLANRVQPIIRYDIGDRVTIHDERCACGSPLPVIDVQGRSDDSLVMCCPGCLPVRLLPLALSTVLEDDAGLFDFQIEQEGPCQLVLRTPLEGDAGHALLVRARKVLEGFLASQGLPRAHVRYEGGKPCRCGPGGKVQRVIGLKTPQREGVLH